MRVQQSEKNTSPVAYMMIYIKSALVGIVTLFVTTIAYIVCVPFVLMRKYPPPPGAEVAFDLRALVNGPFSWLIAVAAFALGFYWEFRRAM